jgi:predicted MPP superfamily phosphohydrolase
LCNLLEKYKCYYTFGNHEERLDEVCKKSFINLVSNNTKIKLLNNSSESLTENIVLYGLDNDIETYTFFGKKALDKEYITSKLGNIDEKKYNILLAHNPLEFASYVHYKANLVLSGHIHGGIVRIPFLKGVLSPDITFFPKYDSGEYNKGNTKMIVSRGLGFSKRIPFRVFNPAEIVVINLKKDL